MSLVAYYIYNIFCYCIKIIP